MRTERVQFANAAGILLDARLDLPAGPPTGMALFAHCFSCGKDLRMERRISAQLTDRGIAVLRFDFTGLGSSEGDFADTNFSSNVADLIAAADWLRQTWTAPTLLIGHSLGGAAVLAAAGKLPEVLGVATIGAPDDPAHVAGLFEAQRAAIERDGEAAVQIGGRDFTVKRQFLADIENASLTASVRDLQRSLLVLHAPGDSIVDIANGERLFAAAQHPKSFAALDGADHLLSNPEHADHAGRVIAAWANDLLPNQLVASDDVAVPADEGEVVVAERGTGKYAQVVRVAQRHALLADEPLGIGDDTGPAPYDLLLAALGTCTTMTIRMYADRKKWPLDDVAVRLTHDRVHADDCAECESESGSVDVIDRELFIEGDLTDEQRARLLEIADKCPVHRTLHNEIHISTELMSS